MLRNRIIVFLILFSTTFSFAQISTVNLNYDIYDYLSKMSQKGIITYNDFVKPISRKTVAQKLIVIRNKSNFLTNLQKDELKFYISEYGYEIGKESGIDESEKAVVKNESESEKEDREVKDSTIRDLSDKSWKFEAKKSEGMDEKEIIGDQFNFAKNDEYGRWRFFNFKNDLMNLNVEPLAGYEIANWEKSNYQNIFLGLKFHGRIGKYVGFNFELKQTRESPRVTSFLYNRFSKNTLIDLQLSDSERLEHAQLNLNIGADWGWGSFTIGKNHLNFGYAENGKIILSERAPSFPYIRLDIKPTNWFRFNYVHAWLNSEVVDSSSYYSTWRYRANLNTDRYSYIPKFLAMHSVTFSFWNGIDLSLGESAVYSDNLQLAYLIPIMFFDLADEYINRSKNYAGASTQLFLALSSKNHVPNTHLYSSFHADELTPEGLFDSKTQYYKFAFTFGASIIDLPIDNLGFRLEYTKVYPGNYRHFIPTLNYESSSALMGHWIGDNGDLVYAAIDYTFLRGLKIKLWTQFIRKGTEAHGNRAYKLQIPQPGFLFTDNISDRKNYSYYGLDVDYEIYHDLFVKFHYQYIDYEIQVSEDKFSSTLYRDISFSFGYGI